MIYMCTNSYTFCLAIKYGTWRDSLFSFIPCEPENINS